MSVVDEFRQLYLHGNGRGPLYDTMKYCGVPIQKCPLDLWIYQELLYQVLPKLVIECGTYHGGSALYLAHAMDRLNHGRILTIDKHPREFRPGHGRIGYLEADSGSCESWFVDDPPSLVVKTPEPDPCLVIGNAKPCMVILDSDHSFEHVTRELQAWSPVVSVGSYLIVEDTILDGPRRAVERFLPQHPEFEPDPDCERLLMTFNPGGYLKRVR